MYSVLKPIGQAIISRVGTLLSYTVIGIALWVLYNTLHGIELADVGAYFLQLSFKTLLLSVTLVVVSYGVMIGYDVIALQHINKPLPFRITALTSFLASAFGNNIGFSLLSGGSIRYRFYKIAGLSTLEIAGVSTLYSMTTVVGMAFFYSVMMLPEAELLLPFDIELPAWSWRLSGIVTLVIMIGYIVLIFFRPITLRWRSWSMRMPSAKLSLAQTVLSTFNAALVAVLIYILLPTPGIGIMHFLQVFALAMFIGGITYLPGGIGVVESILLLGLKEIPPATLLGALVSFRFLYYLLPLGVAAIVLSLYETGRWNPSTAPEERV